LLNCFAQTKRDKQQWKRQFSLSPFEFGPVCVAKRGTTWKMERVEDLSINNLIIVFKTSKKTTGRQQHNQTMDGNAIGFVNKEVA